METTTFATSISRGKMYYHDNNLSVSEKLFNSGLCLPSGSNMTDSEQEFVIDEFKKYSSRCDIL